MKKIGFILLGIICILFSSRWTLTAQADAGTLLSLEDGEYAIEVTMTGGSGKASIQKSCSSDGDRWNGIHIHHMEQFQL